MVYYLIWKKRPGNWNSHWKRYFRFAKPNQNNKVKWKKSGYRKETFKLRKIWETVQNNLYSNRPSVGKLYQDFGHLYRISLPNIGLM